MTKRALMIRQMMLAALVMLLSACSAAPTPTPEPTLDPQVIHTQAAATVYARETAAVTPTFTPTITATATREPTITPLPPTPTLGTPLPTATEQIVGDAAQFTGTAPAAGVEIVPNEHYNLEFDLLNVGTTTWTTGYSLVLVGGEAFTNVHVIPLDREVPPGKKGVFILGTFGSEDMNQHWTYWQLYNASGIPVPGGRAYFWYQPK